jgi:hypothetical protein
MRRAATDTLSDRAIWFLVGAVFLCVLLVLITVLHHDRQKPTSPQALVAAAFNQLFPVKEWKPGMGKKPFVYHPAGFDRLVWQPLPSRSTQPGRQMGPGTWPPAQGQGGVLNRAPMVGGGGPTYGTGRP